MLVQGLRSYRHTDALDRCDTNCVEIKVLSLVPI